MRSSGKRGSRWTSWTRRRPSADAELWERVIARLAAGSMPPAGRPRPGAEETRAVTSWLETQIDQAAAANPNPGRTASMHRLNRTEYGNAIRDLLALEIDVAAMLPGDETSDTGFDNNAEVLSISTAQLERYLSAARKISRLATGVMTAPGFRALRELGAADAGGPAERGPAARIPRRPFRDAPFSGRRQLHLPHRADDQLAGLRPRHGQKEPARPPHRRQARPAVHGGGRGAGHAGSHDLVAGRGGRPRVGAVRPRVCRPPGDPGAGRCRTACRRGLVRPEPMGARGTAAAGDEGSGPVEQREVPRARGGPDADDRRPLRGRGSRGHAEPAQNLRVRSRHRTGGGGVRRADPLEAGPPRLSRAADGSGRRDAARVLPGRAGEGGGQLRRRHPARARTAARRSGLPAAGAGGPARRGGGTGVRAGRPGARLTPVVLPVEQHPPTRNCSTSPSAAS